VGSGTTNVLRYDGVYYCVQVGYRQFLKFFPDGTVIGVSASGTAEQVSRWIDTTDNKGRYKTVGARVTFSLTSPQGVVDYSGDIFEASLVVDSHSHINGHCSRRQDYSFTCKGKESFTHQFADY
jgi:hypothetical protein